MSSHIHWPAPTPQSLIIAFHEPPSCLHGITSGWQEAMDRMPDQLPAELTAEEIIDAANWTDLEPEVAGELLRQLPAWWEDPFLRALLWYCVFHLNQSDSPQNFLGLPSLKHRLGPYRGLFYLLTGLSIIPAALQSYRRQGIAEPVIRQTLRQLRCYCDNHRLCNDGVPGLLVRQMNWLRQYRTGRLYRLGRLEYRLDRARQFGLFLKQRRSGHKIMLAEHGQRFDRHGFIEYEGEPDNQCWQADLVENGRLIWGFSIAPEGYAINRRQKYSLEDWEVMVRNGDPVIDLHIPAGEPLTLAACQDSFEAATAFFRNTQREKTPRIFWCNSWIFNPLFEQEMPDSNLAALQRESYLFPVLSSGRDGLFFVFCRDNENFTEWPRRTRLQKTMLSRVESGRKLRSGGMVIAVEDLPFLGRQYYRRGNHENSDKIRNVSSV